MAWTELTNSDAFPAMDAFMLDVGSPAKLEEAKRFAVALQFGAFVVWSAPTAPRVRASFRNKTPTEVLANRFDSRSSAVYVAPALGGHVGSGSLARPSFIDDKYEDEWARLPLSITAMAAACRLCLAVVWKVGGNPVRGRLRIVIRRHGAVVQSVGIDARMSGSPYMYDQLDMPIDIRAGDQVEFEGTTGNHIQLSHGDRCIGATVFVKELKCVLWPDDVPIHAVVATKRKRRRSPSRNPRRGRRRYDD
eukprot:gnl/TRDRNA2_/TRDRNA2_94418_c0_seq1.p1 gnl/TRDRNA2_/TRDRNA2_94418_c0~~gnl/TRDRNA2_/TRDRNA2_94418_c0_seq1.p1  ORF type:complete len:249 (-),score=30.44 gnl/TRDRNA2_/TRDRNA2_94418_c0_seq1:16-762(-)